jgi:hypothetical protein
MPRRFLLIVIFIYLVVGFLIVPHYLYRLNPDGVSYINIAEKYARGEWQHAINGYWGPLYCWLLALFIVVGIEPLLASKLLSLAIGSITLVAVNRLALVFNLSDRTRSGLLIISAINILFFAYVFITPDLLVVCTLLWYLAFLWQGRYPAHPGKAVQCGIAGSLAYFSKAYLFPFFIFHFSATNLYYFLTSRNGEKIRIRNQFLYGLALFFCISSIWITLLSVKYDRLVYSTSGTFNVPLNRQSYDNGMPFYFTGFLAPPNATAMSAWEDPSYTAFKMAAPSKRSVMDQVRYQGYTILRNIYGFWLILWGQLNLEMAVFSTPFMAMVCVLALLYITLARKNISRHTWMPLLLTIAIYCGGYLLVRVGERFFWGIFILLILAALYMLDVVWSILAGYNKKIPIAMFSIFIVAATYRTTVSMIELKDSGKEHYQVAEQIKQKHDIKGNVVSDANWDDSLILCYYLGCNYYGRVAKNNLQQDVAGDLKKFSIDYMLSWKEPSVRWPLELTAAVDKPVAVRLYAVLP